VVNDGITVGYVSASLAGPGIEAQIDALRAAGVADWHIFAEDAGGASGCRPKLEELQRFVREGDTVTVTKLDRLGRSLDDLRAMLHRFEEHGVGVVILEPDIDTRTSVGRAMLAMLALFSEFETDVRRERQLEGVARAKARGVKLGRRRSVEPDAVIAAYRRHGTIAATAQALGSTKPTVHRVLKAAGVDTRRKTAGAPKGRR